jgi:glycosyltransferase involved in cell wall biosynthesis
MNLHFNLSKTRDVVWAYSAYVSGLIKLNSSKKYDLVINTYGDLVNSIADLAYVHFPIKATLDFAQTPVFVSPVKWRVYCEAYNLLTTGLDKLDPSILLTNSAFTRQVVKRYLKRDATVLYPPVDVKKYASSNVKRENCIVTISKFTPKRHLNRIPLIAKKMRSAKFYVIGGADKYSEDTIKQLRGTIRKCGVENNVILLPNASRCQLMEILTHAKAYLHVMPDEHFGISIVEAMASGCVPIVHRSGGPWIDLLGQQQGKTGFSYSSVLEAADLLDLVISDDRLRSRVSFEAQRRSLNYDRSIFQQKLISIVNKLAS